MNFFDKITMKKPKRNTFPLDHNHIFTMNIGDLVPAYFNYCVPGDVITIKTDFMAKFSPLVSPAFARMKVKTEHFFVPFSQLFTNYQEVLMNYKGESQTVVQDGVSTTETYTEFPYISADDISRWNNKIGTYTGTDAQLKDLSRYDFYGLDLGIHKRRCNSLLDYMGLPLPFTTFRYRSAAGSAGNNPNPQWLDLTGLTAAQCQDTNNYYYGLVAQVRAVSGMPGNVMLKRDTTANPFVDFKINTLWARAYQKVYSDWYRNPLMTDPVDIYENTVYKTYANNADYNRYYNSLFFLQKRNYRKDYFNTAAVDPTLGPSSVNIPTTVVELSKAKALQRILDKKAVAGNRFYDWLKFTWNVFADNYEIDRSVYLGGSTQNVQISEVLQTSESSDDSALGSRAGEANLYGVGSGSKFVAPDYGVILTIVSLIPEIDYMCGVNRLLTKTTWEDFPMPELAQIGMQQINQTELKYPVTPPSGTSPDLQSTFGFTPRYSEFKQMQNRISGEFRHNLSYWHQSPNYYEDKNALTSMIGNNKWFSEIGQGSEVAVAYQPANEYYNNIFAVTSDEVADHCQASMYFDIKVNRALPVQDMPHL